LYFNLGGGWVAFILVLRVGGGVLPNRHGRGEKMPMRLTTYEKSCFGCLVAPLIGASYVPASHRGS
jgi:hypothetical protein